MLIKIENIKKEVIYLFASYSNNLTSLLSKKNQPSSSEKNVIQLQRICVGRDYCSRNSNSYLQLVLLYDASLDNMLLLLCNFVCILL